MGGTAWRRDSQRKRAVDFLNERRKRLVEKFEEEVERLGDMRGTHKVQVVFVTCPNYLL